MASRYVWPSASSAGQQLLIFKESQAFGLMSQLPAWALVMSSPHLLCLPPSSPGPSCSLLMNPAPTHLPDLTPHAASPGLVPPPTTISWPRETSFSFSSYSTPSRNLSLGQVSLLGFCIALDRHLLSLYILHDFLYLLICCSH